MDTHGITLAAWECAFLFGAGLWMTHRGYRSSLLPVEGSQRFRQFCKVAGPLLVLGGGGARRVLPIPGSLSRLPFLWSQRSMAGRVAASRSRDHKTRRRGVLPLR